MYSIGQHSNLVLPGSPIGETKKQNPKHPPEQTPPKLNSALPSLSHPIQTPFSLTNIENIHSPSQLSAIKERIIDAVINPSSKESYLDSLKNIFDELRWEDLPEIVHSKWNYASQGFHTIELFKEQHNEINIQFKAYLTVINPDQKTSGGLIVTPHSHVSIEGQNNLKQAVTYVANIEGDIVIEEGHFTKIDEHTVVHESSSTRDLHSFSFDENPNNIHNFEAHRPFESSLENESGLKTADESSSKLPKALILVVYITPTTQPNPNQTYYTEQITNSDRANYLSRLADDGYTPYLPAHNFQAYTITDVLKRTLPDDQNPIHKLSKEGLQQKVQNRNLIITSVTTEADIQNKLIEWNLPEALSTPSVQHSLQPILDLIQTGNINAFILSWKHETNSCEESAQFRVNLSENKIGVSLDNELRISVRQSIRLKELIIFISTAKFLANPQLLGTYEQADLSQFQIVNYALNPFNLYKGLEENVRSFTENFTKLTIYIHSDLNKKNDTDFITNNAGSRYLSLTTYARPYIESAKLKFQSLATQDNELTNALTVTWEENDKKFMRLERQQELKEKKFKNKKK